MYKAILLIESMHSPICRIDPYTVVYIIHLNHSTVIFSVLCYLSNLTSRSCGLGSSPVAGDIVLCS